MWAEYTRAVHMATGATDADIWHRRSYAEGLQYHCLYWRDKASEITRARSMQAIFAGGKVPWVYIVTPGTVNAPQLL